MKIKTIDIQAKDWFDKINGNSYFSAMITLNYGTKTEKRFFLPFQYGYGDHYIDMAGKLLMKNKSIKLQERLSLWRYCEENNVTLRTSKQEGCLKRDVLAWGIE